MRALNLKSAILYEIALKLRIRFATCQLET